MSTWSITESDVLTVTLIYGDLEYVIRKSDMYYEPYDQDTILVTFRKFTYKKFAVTPIDVVPVCYMLDWEECTSPIATSRADLLVLLEAMLQSDADTKVQKNGIDVGQEPILNFIEGSNITITAVDDPTNNKVDITIDASGSTGGVTAVTGTSPISSTGGTTPDISIAQADSAHDGYLSSTDWNTFNNKVSSVTATSVLTSSGGDNPNISSQVNKGKLLGRNSVTAGIMEEITVAGPGLTLVGTTLSATTQVVGYEMNFLLMGG
jgi:hypothetical protein